MSEINIPRKCKDCLRLSRALGEVDSTRAQAEEYNAAELKDSAVARLQARLLASANAGKAAVEHLLGACPGLSSPPEGTDFGWLSPTPKGPDCGTDDFDWGYVGDSMTKAYNKEN